MSRHSVPIRAANQSYEEGLLYAHYLDEAFEGLFRTVVGRQYAAIVATAYTQPDHDFSYQNTLFGEHDGAVVGMVCGYTAEQHRRSPFQPLRLAAGDRILRRIGVAMVCARLRLLSIHADGDFYIQALAVDRELRGLGIGSALIEGIEDRARSRGCRRLCLDVASRNKGARRLYEHRGMTVERGRLDKLHIPHFVIRMTKPL